MIPAAYADGRGAAAAGKATLVAVLHELRPTVDGDCPRCRAAGGTDPFCPVCEERECRQLRQRLFGIAAAPDRRADRAAHGAARIWT